MWCSSCQQDVPGLGSPGSGDPRCGKCGRYLASEPQSTTSVSQRIDSSPTVAATATENAAIEKVLRFPALPEEDWALEAELRGVERLLANLKSPPSSLHESLSVHFSHKAQSASHVMLGREADLDPIAPLPEAEQPRRNPAAWAILSLSIAVFACGAVLLAWSLLGEREDLWPIGMPLALIGQAGLILGAVLQLETLSSRVASSSLYQRGRVRGAPQLNLRSSAH